ncbi:MAG: TetR/AcrR family transcriptional regulator [Woeseia sp.]|nr:TetR/AcrR family transcriptional regulator [Woeseia sp.]
MSRVHTRTDSASLTQAERSARSDRAMLDAAVDLLLEHGTEKTTLAAIGEKAGYSRGLATYRFGSKAALFDEVCKSIGRRWITYLQAGVGDKTGIDAMLAALNAFFRFLSDSPREARVLHILYCGAASPTSEYRETSRGIHQRQMTDVANWVRAGINDGSIREDADADSVATQYVAYTTGITYLWVINPEAIDFDKASASMKKQLTRSLST